MQIETIDLDGIVATLARTLDAPSREGFVRGRTTIRNAILSEMSCSEREAEQLVDTMIGRGFLRFSGDPTVVEGGGVWLLSKPEE